MKTKLECGCTPDASGYGYCGKCTSALRKKIWREMSPEKKRFDREIDPIGSAHMDAELRSEGCSCHINPPCSYCVSQGDEDE